jgi:hypothetical protein
MLFPLGHSAALIYGAVEWAVRLILVFFAVFFELFFFLGENLYSGEEYIRT